MAEKILIVDDEAGMRQVLELMLSGEDFEVTTTASAKEALAALANDHYDFILSDIRMPETDGLDLLKKIKERDIDTTVIMMSAYGTIDTAVEAMKLGAYDYISKPFKTDEVVLTLRKAQERERLKRENILLKQQVQKQYSFANIISRNEKMQEIFEVISKVADYKTSVLINGESGTGKELIAKALHFNGSRRKRPFVAVNCGAIPENLLESELFGHVKGAFTDAIRDKKGLMLEAHGGTLFLDEISELPHNLQVKILRVLQENEVRRVGDSKNIPIDVRFVAASIGDLAQQVKEGKFREDLFYRLNVLQIKIHPLRERTEDIPLLADHFIKKIREDQKSNVESISSEANKLLMQFNWPGNVRELENVIERAMVLSPGPQIRPEDLPDYIRDARSSWSVDAIVDSEDLSIKKLSKDLEKQLIMEALKRTAGNRTRAAKLLEISHPALLSKMKAYEIQ